MHTRIHSYALIAAALVVCGTAWAAADSIGVATANGKFRVNDSEVRGNATVFEGSVIETGAEFSRVRLANGVRVGLGTNSKATFGRDRLVLESGTSELAVGREYAVEAGAFRVEPASSDGMARVTRRGEKLIEVAAIRGTVRVFHGGRLQIANVPAGAAFSFDPQDGGAAPPSSVLGCLLKKEGKFVVYDQTTRIVVELRGNQDFASEVGNRVQVIGTTDTSATSDVAAQVVNVSTLARFGEGGCDPVAAAIGAEGAEAVSASPQPAGRPDPTQPAPPTQTTEKGGVSAGVIIAIVALGGGGGAAAAVLASGGDDGRSR